MAQECRAVIGSIDLLKRRHLGSSTTKQLDDARYRLQCASLFLAKLEEVGPENTISTQLGALFQQAHDGFSEIFNHMDQRYTSRMTKVLKIIKLENIAVRFTTASKPSRSTREMISEVLNILKHENIAERIKASKPSTSSSRITTVKMVRFVNVLLDYAQDRDPGPYLFFKKLRHLQTFFELTASRCIEHESMQYFFTHVEDVAYTALQLCFLPVAYNSNFNLELLELVNPFRPDLKQMYKSLLTASKSSRSETTMKPGYTLDFVNALREDLEENPGYVQIEWLKQGLRNLSKVLMERIDTRAPLKEFSSLQSLIEALAIETAFVIYSNDEYFLFHLQLKFHHVNVEIELIKLLNSRETMTAPLKDLIDYAWNELIVVRTFLIDSLEQSKQQTRITDLFTLIQSVTYEAFSDIKYLLCYAKREDLAWEMKHSHFKLLLKFNFIKAAIRQMCPTISASSSTEIYLLNFLPIKFEVIDSYFCSKKSFSGHHNMDLVMMGFHEYILDNLLLKDETDLSFTVADRVKKFYYGLLLLLTSLLDPLATCSGFGTIAIEAKSVNSNKSNLVLRFLTVALKLIESERSLTDLLEHKATLEAYILDLIESANEELIYLRALLIEVLRNHTEFNELHHVLMHAEVTANKIALIIEGRSIEEIGLLVSAIRSVKVEVRIVCFQFLDTSPYIMTDGEGLINFLLDRQDRLLNCDACSIPFQKNQIPVIKDKLVYLGSFIADIVQHRDMYQELKDLVKRVQDIKFVCLFPIRHYTPPWYYRLHFYDVRQLLKLVEKEVKMICLKVPDSSSYSFPKINELGFLDCFLGKLDEILSSKLESVIDLKLQIGSVKEGLLCLRTLTDHFPDIYDEHDEVYSLITRVAAMAYKAEYVMDSCLTYSYPLWYKVLWISEAVENIKLLNEVVRETCGRKKIDVTVHKVRKTSTYLVPSLSANTPGSNEEMESFQEAMDQMKKGKAELWKDIEESLGLLNIDSLEESMSVIGFSYRNLPHQLKPCFLYFGGLLKEKDIHVSKLTRLWIAEGFVHANKENGLEDAAEGLLEDLISRNLVMDVEKRPNGKLKTCRVHDLLHKFCMEKSKQENFLLQINGFTGEDTFPEMSMEYRLFVHTSEDQIDLWQPSRSNVRSLLFNVIDSDNLLLPHNISFIFDSFKLVKVLDLESVNIGGTFPTEIQFLIHLKYFAAETGGNSIPSSIAKLWNLETFVIRGLGGEVILPSSLLTMVKMRNIHVNHRASFSLPENMSESLADSQLDNLETFSTPHLSYGEDTEMILRMMPKLRKLSCIFSGTFDYSEKVKGRRVLFPRLEFLSHLESLKLVSNSYPAKLPHIFSFPSRLRELTLSKFRLPWSQISTIGELPNLEILKLLL